MKPVRNTSTFRLKINSAHLVFEGAKWVCSNTTAGSRRWTSRRYVAGAATNDLQIVSTDHCPFCMKEQKELGLNDFRAIPNGIGGIEHRMESTYQGVVTGQISLPRWVELTSTTPALMFGLQGKKGVIQPGADADLVIYDPAGHTSIGYEKTHHMNMDYSAWEGFEVDGHVDWVMSSRHGADRRLRLRRYQRPRSVPEAWPERVSALAAASEIARSA